MSETKTLDSKTQAKETIHEHIVLNSFFNVVEFDNWEMGICDEEEAARKWCEEYGSGMINFWQVVDCGSVETANEVLTYFRSIGVPESEGTGSSGGKVYVYKTFI